MCIKTVHLDRKLSATARLAKRSTIVESAHWILGGKICGVRLQETLVFPYVELIEKEAYDPSLRYSPVIANDP